MSVASEFQVDPEREVVVLQAVAGDVQPPEDERVNVVFSHIRPQPGIGYDERRYVSLWGPCAGRRADWSSHRPRPALGRAGDDVLRVLGARRAPGAPLPGAGIGRAGPGGAPEARVRVAVPARTRLPFLTATFVPILLGIAVAAWANGFNWWVALLTLIGGACIHLGLNVANDVFDTTSGADAANVNPTQFSGGSRVVHYGLMSLRTIALMSFGFYAVGIAIGLVLAASRGWDLLWLGVAGVILSLFYTAPPFKLVHRGLGEIVVAAGFGPIMTLGAYYVQAQEYDLEPLLASPVGS